MRRIIIAALVGVAVAGTFATAKTRPQPIPDRCTAAAHRTFSASVWRLDGWKRGKPPESTVEAHQRRLACAPAPHKVAMKRQWRRDAAAFFAHRSDELFRERYLPYHGCTQTACRDYAIPAVNVDCESGGGLGGIYPNIYGIIDYIWALYGGQRYTNVASEASFREQSIIATAIREDVGVYQGWERWEIEQGCSHFS